MTMAVYSFPRRLPHISMYYPSAPFVRSIYLLLEPCTWDKCYGNYNLAPDEFHEMTFILLLNAIGYTVLALYLNQVIPQTYGVPKHPLFFLEPILKKISPKLCSTIFEDLSHLEHFVENNELKDEDQDVRVERQFVHNLDRKEYI